VPALGVLAAPAAAAAAPAALAVATLPPVLLPVRVGPAVIAAELPAVPDALAGCLAPAVVAVVVMGVGALPVAPALCALLVVEGSVVAALSLPHAVMHVLSATAVRTSREASLVMVLAPVAAKHVTRPFVFASPEPLDYKYKRDE
jgi:hypothetical protein